MALSFNGKEVNKICFNNNVGYTKVGNPSIVDGVASGFSRSDYLTTTAIPSNSDIEFNIQFTISQQWDSTIGIFRLGPSDYRGILGSASGSNLRLSYRTIGSSWASYKSFAVGFGTPITYNMKYYKTDNSLVVKATQNGQSILDWSIVGVEEEDFTTIVRLGTTNYGFTNGSIDLNETYIKVNGITWFSGKERASKDVNYVIKDGKLVWANPNVYLRFPARQSASEGFGCPIIDTGILITDTSFGLQVKYRAYKNPFEGLLLVGNIWSYRYQKDRISIFEKTNEFSTLLNNSICTLKWDGPAGLATLKLGDGRIETIQSVAGTNIGSSTQKLGSTWNYQTGFDYYCFKVFQNNTLIQYLVPVPAGLKICNYTVPANGMWDIVSQQFFGNSGTGEFMYGKDE